MLRVKSGDPFLEVSPYAEDAGYYSAAPNVSGFAGTTFPPTVLDDNAYGVDIQVQEAEVSDDWELVAFSG